MKNLHEILDQALPVIYRAGAYVRSATPQKIDEKSGHTDLVTEYDVNTQRMLMEQLAVIDPDARFVGEEEHQTADVTTGDCFVIDPIDGTTNFILDFGRSAISVALLRDGEPVIGVVYNPYRDEMFTAIRGEGAFRNGKPIAASTHTLADSVISFGTAPYYPELMRRTFRVTTKIMESALDVRRLSSAALDLCDAASGRCGAFFELRLNPWDHAAGGLIIKEAGGVITDAEGNEVGFEKPSSIVAGGKTACADLLRILKDTE